MQEIFYSEQPDGRKQLWQAFPTSRSVPTRDLAGSLRRQETIWLTSIRCT